MKKTRAETTTRKDRKRKAGTLNLQRARDERHKRKKEREEKELIYPKEGDSILTMKKEWIEKVLSTIKRIQKRMEVRPTICKKPKGKIIYLSETGTGKIQGYVTFDGCKKLTQRTWAKHRHLHRIPGGLYYTGRTEKTNKLRENWGLYFKDPHTFPTPIPYVIVKGSRDWRYYHSI